MVWRKKINAQPKFLRCIQRAAGERIVERTAFDAKDQSYRGIGSKRGWRRKRGSERTGRGEYGETGSMRKPVHKRLLIRVLGTVLAD
jgi:hypothetical protein